MGPPSCRKPRGVLGVTPRSPLMPRGPLCRLYAGSRRARSPGRLLLVGGRVLRLLCLLRQSCSGSMNLPHTGLHTRPNLEPWDRSICLSLDYFPILLVVVQVGARFSGRVHVLPRPSQIALGSHARIERRAPVSKPFHFLAVSAGHCSEGIALHFGDTAGLSSGLWAFSSLFCLG